MNHKKRVRKILLYQFITMVIFNMAHPVTPALITTLSYPSYSFGLLFAVMSTMTFVTAPVWGYLSEKYGVKKIMTIGPLGSAIGQLGFGLSKTFGATIFFRAFTGSFAMATILLSIVSLTEVSDNENNGKNLAYSAGLTGTGSMLGYLIGGIIGDYGYIYTFYLQVLFLLLLIILVRVLIDDNGINEKSSPSNLSPLLLFKKVGSYISKPIGKYFIFMFLLTCAFTLYTTTIPFYLNTIWNFHPSFIGYFMAYSGIITLISNTLLLPVFIKKTKAINILLIETIILFVCLMSLLILVDVKLLFPIFTLYLVFLPMYIPLNHMMIAKNLDKDKAIIFGIMNSFRSLGMIIGSFSAGFLYELNYNFPFIFATILFGFTGILILFYRKK